MNAQGETLTFEHTCVTAPCTINQIHVPSIYPKNLADWAWQNGVVRFYIDGETSASIELKLLELSWVSEYASPAHAALKPGASGAQYDNRGLPYEEFCVKNEELCIKNEELCTENEEFWI